MHLRTPKMDPSQFMILPKGFVVNSEDIYKEVASYPVVPPEKIREYWGGKWAPWPEAGFNIDELLGVKLRPLVLAF